jgi:hypothetical protein
MASFGAKDEFGTTQVIGQASTMNDFASKLAGLSRSGWKVIELHCSLYDQLCKKNETTGKPRILE